MQIKKFQQSGFIIEATSGFTLALDIGAFTPTEQLAGIAVDAVLVSHLHGDHFSIPQIKILSAKKLYLNKECVELLGEEKISSDIVQVTIGDTIDMGDIKVRLFDVDHGPNVKVRPEENFGFLIEVDGETIYFAGDMFYPSGLDVSTLEVDYALIPVGTFYTFGPQEALAFVKQFKRIGKVVPMHYEKTQETKDEFIALAESSGVPIKSFSI